MKPFLVYLVVLFNTLHISYATFGATTFMKIQELAKKQREVEYLQQGGFQEVEGYAFDHYVDHFEAAANRVVFSQRYWRNKAYWKQPNGPVFLYVGGESALSGIEISAGHIVDMAKQHGALLFSVEHRFYGQSIFQGGLKDNNIPLLSSQQALADLAIFMRYAKVKFGLTKKNKWIAYGGSYPGALAAWFRLKYPHLVIGAVASSAPVEAKANFEGYNNVVAAGLASQLVGGSEQCVDNINDAFEQVEEYITEKKFSQLQKDFASCNNISKINDTWMFSFNLASFVMGVVQYNQQVSGLDISTLCKYMTNTSNVPYNNLAHIYTEFMSRYSNCITNSYSAFIDQLKNTAIDPEGSSMARQWYYQKCTQFGYFHSCDHSTRCVLSRRISFTSLVNSCQDVFHIKVKDVQERVSFTNEYYGSNKTRGSKIIFVNGSIDPWHALGVLRNLSSSEISIFIPGASHCQNMASNKYDSSPALKEARQQISSIIGKWLSKAQQT